MSKILLLLGFSVFFVQAGAQAGPREQYLVSTQPSGLPFNKNDNSPFEARWRAWVQQLTQTPTHFNADELNQMIHRVNTTKLKIDLSMMAPFASFWLDQALPQLSGLSDNNLRLALQTLGRFASKQPALFQSKDYTLLEKDIIRRGPESKLFNLSRYIYFLGQVGVQPSAEFQSFIKPELMSKLDESTPATRANILHTLVQLDIFNPDGEFERTLIGGIKEQITDFPEWELANLLYPLLTATPKPKHNDLLYSPLGQLLGLNESHFQRRPDVWLEKPFPELTLRLIQLAAQIDKNTKPLSEKQARTIYQALEYDRLFNVTGYDARPKNHPARVKEELAKQELKSKLVVDMKATVRLKNSPEKTALADSLKQKYPQGSAFQWLDLVGGYADFIIPNPTPFGKGTVYVFEDPDFWIVGPNGEKTLRPRYSFNTLLLEKDGWTVVHVKTPENPEPSQSKAEVKPLLSAAPVVSQCVQRPSGFSDVTSMASTLTSRLNPNAASFVPTVPTVAAQEPKPAQAPAQTPAKAAVKPAPKYQIRFL